MGLSWAVAPLVTGCLSRGTSGARLAEQRQGLATVQVKHLHTVG